jgi:hypothetical protein
METEELYELVVDAVRQAIADEAGGGRVQIHKRLAMGTVIFRDDEGRTVKEIPAPAIFQKITAVREKLRLIEQKINNNANVGAEERAEIQALLTRCYGSLTTFNFLFRDEGDKFHGTGG